MIGPLRILFRAAVVCGALLVQLPVRGEGAAAAGEVSSGVKGVQSLPTVVDPWNIDSDFAKVNQQWASIEAVLKDPIYFKERSEEVSKWSCGLQAGHVTLVLKMIADGIDDNLKNPGRNVDGEHARMTKMIFTRGIIPRGVGEAPKAVMPLLGSREGWLKTLGETRKRWEEFERNKEKLVACPGRFPHFAFGQLTSSDWVRFAGIHTAHHLKIVRDILQKTGGAEKGFGAELK